MIVNTSKQHCHSHQCQWVRANTMFVIYDPAHGCIVYDSTDRSSSSIYGNRLGYGEPTMCWNVMKSVCRTPRFVKSDEKWNVWHHQMAIYTILYCRGPWWPSRILHWWHIPHKIYQASSRSLNLFRAIFWRRKLGRNTAWVRTVGCIYTSYNLYQYKFNVVSL